MLNFVQYINNLLFLKDKSLANKECCSDQISSFVLNRWASFYDKQNCLVINANLNRSHIYEDFNLLSKLLVTFIPKKSYRKIFYIKKIKDESENPTPVICKIMQIGTRDAELVRNTTGQEDLKSFLKIYKEA
jgi:hypothetical protein